VAQHTNHAAPHHTPRTTQTRLDSAQHSAAQHSTAQHSTAQHNTAQHSTTQHSAAQHSTAQHSTAYRDTKDPRSLHCRQQQRTLDGPFQGKLFDGDGLDFFSVALSLAGSFLLGETKHKQKVNRAAAQQGVSKEKQGVAYHDDALRQFPSAESWQLLPVQASPLPLLLPPPLPSDVHAAHTNKTKTKRRQTLARYPRISVALTHTV